MQRQHICFVTTGDMISNAIAKRALGLANHLYELGWKVSILLQDTFENRHRAKLECDDRINVLYFPKTNAVRELACKEKIIRSMRPDYLYISAFVTRDVVGLSLRCKKIVEHSELQSGIVSLNIFRRVYCMFFEYASLLYADYIVNASIFLDKVFKRRSARICKRNLPMLYLPYAFHSKNILINNNNEIKLTTFVFLGTIIRDYGVFTILEAVKELVHLGKKFILFLLGKGKDFEEARSFISVNQLEEYVISPGFVLEEDIDWYFERADSFISPMSDTVQDWARCPSKLYMYLPYKKPIITCRIGEPYQVLKDEGLYYSPGNAKELAQKMELVIDKHKTKISIDISKYTWRENAITLDSFIKDNL